MTKPTKKTGRPTDFSPEIANEICERLMKGQSLRFICRDEEGGWIPSERTIYRWLETNEPFRQQYAHAREVQADTLVDQIVSIADGEDINPDASDGEKAAAMVRDAARDRLRMDARKWVASKLAPKKYGEKVALTGGDADDAPIKTAVTVTFV